MEKTLGFRLVDSIREVSEIENLKMQLSSALYVKKVEEKIKSGIDALVNDLKGQATVYGVNIENYTERVEEIKKKYLTEIEKVKGEYAFQFVNMQLELREALANQKIALANAKKMLDLKREYIDANKNALSNFSLTQITEFKNKVDAYEDNKQKYLKKYYDYNVIIKDCEIKIEKSISETFSQIENISSKIIDNSILVKNENVIMKFINKISNLFTGKAKFETKVMEAEEKISESNLECGTKAEEVRNNTIDLVADIQNKKDSLNLTGTL